MGRRTIQRPAEVDWSVLKRMGITKQWVRAIVVLLIGAWSTNVGHAAFDYTILGGGDLVGGFSVSIDGHSENGILVGGIQVNLVNNNPPSQLPPDYAKFETVCVDLEGQLYLGSTYTFDKVGFDGQSGLNPAWGNTRDIINANGSDKQNAASQAINNAAYLYSTATPATATDWAALQLAVWKVAYDTKADGTIDWNADTERFNVTKDMNDAWVEAQSLLGSLPRNTDYVGYLLKPSDMNLNAQELLMGVTATDNPNPQTVAVPETGTLIAGVLLFLPLGASALKIFRGNRSV
jgi:hypothetical protein